MSKIIDLNKEDLFHSVASKVTATIAEDELHLKLHIIPNASILY